MKEILFWWHLGKGHTMSWSPAFMFLQAHCTIQTSLFFLFSYCDHVLHLINMPESDNTGNTHTKNHQDCPIYWVVLVIWDLKYTFFFQTRKKERKRTKRKNATVLCPTLEESSTRRIEQRSHRRRDKVSSMIRRTILESVLCSSNRTLASSKRTWNKTRQYGGCTQGNLRGNLLQRPSWAHNGNWFTRNHNVRRSRQMIRRYNNSASICDSQYGRHSIALTQGEKETRFHS